ncbi:MAG: undecaprenyl/decaprenyl-phosphate alpha-N-acetylglucosaminyl 1-phosphate transferase [Elusimicrobia bacterium]|nr:undecaprenyl/decaprenyl-phosphate alpha-N-acetylglucosaminyl 1-phosphate transferase [Elusimicrobiota bacterium]
MIRAQILAFFMAFAGTACLVPVFMGLSRRFGVMDFPDPRKVHAKPTPRWGGGAIAGGVFLGLGATALFAPWFLTLLDYRFRIIEEGETVGILSLKAQLTGVLLGGLVCVVLGMWDDRRSLPPVVKLLAQIIAAYIAMMYGVRMAGLALPGFGFVTFPLLLSQFITLFWLLGFMNAINLTDGLDGLAGGICAIAAGTFLFVALLQADTKIVLYAKQLNLASVLAAAVCGACVGFLIYNFNPARVFMGDGGALFLGFMLGTISIIGTLKTSAVIALIIPILVVALPVMDVTFTLIRRARQRQGLMVADRGHFHHQLLALGWTQREVVLLVYVITLLLSMTALLLTFFRGKV